MLGRLLSLVALAAVLAAAAPAAASVPHGWVGMQVDGPLIDGRANLDEQLTAMEAAGVTAIRFVIDWGGAQPYATAAEVPEAERARFATEVDGVPTDFSTADAMIAAAGRHDLDVTAVVLRAPAWATAEPLFYAPPSEAGRSAYARFLTTLVDRYGTGGPLAGEHPVTRWQVWNEPNGPYFWAEQNVKSRYVDLLKVAYPAIKAADPNAQVIAAGLFGFSWKFLNRIYRRGGGPFFDVVAIHPFTQLPENVVRILEYVRKVMRRHGDAAKPIAVTELSWPASLGKVPDIEPEFVTDDAGQPRRLRKAYRLIAAQRRRLGIENVTWSTWATTYSSLGGIFDYSGLFKVLPDNSFEPRRAFGAFRAVVVKITR